MTTLGTGALGDGTLGNPQTAALPGGTLGDKTLGDGTLGNPNEVFAFGELIREADFVLLLGQSHTVVTRADVLRGGERIASGLPVTSGSVTIDRRAAVRRRATLTLVDEKHDLVPTTAAHLLAPYGNEIALWRGIVASGWVEGTDGAPPRREDVEQLWPLGVFGINSIEASYDGELAIEGYDRAKAASRATLETPFVIGGGTNYVDAIESVLRLASPGLVLMAPSTIYTTPTLVFDIGDDPWAKAQEMAVAIGLELRYSVTGVPELVEPPSLATPAATFTDDGRSTLIDLVRSLTADEGYNSVTVIGEGGSSPVIATARDLDPASPTYYDGPYGRRPLPPIRSELVGSQPQALTMARGVLAQRTGSTQRLSIEALVDPRRDAGDALEVVCSRLGLDGVELADTVTIPLEAEGTMSMTTSARSAL